MQSVVCVSSCCAENREQLPDCLTCIRNPEGCCAGIKKLGEERLLR